MLAEGSEGVYLHSAGIAEKGDRDHLRGMPSCRLHARRVQLDPWARIAAYVGVPKARCRPKAQMGPRIAAENEANTPNQSKSLPER